MQGILAITWKQFTVGAAYFEPSSRTLFVMEDGHDVRHLDLVETSCVTGDMRREWPFAPLTDRCAPVTANTWCSQAAGSASADPDQRRP